VLGFPSGATALDALSKTLPDVILLDIVMPEMDGFEVCRRLKADETLREIPVIFISGLDDTANKIKAFAEGGVDYVTKPFQREEILVRVKTHLNLRHMQRELEKHNRHLEDLVREKIKEKLRIEQRSREFSEDIFNFIPEGILVLSHEMDLLRNNRSFHDLVCKHAKRLGYTGEEFEAMIINNIRTGLREGNLEELRIVAKEGYHKGSRSEELILDLNMTGMVFANSGEEVIIVSIKDITDQKLMTEQMIRTEKLNSLGQLSAGLAHELKNPLAIISSCAQFCLERMELERLARENLQVIFRSSKQANRLIEELLGFARPSRLLKEEVDINELLFQTVEIANLEMQSHKTEFTTDFYTNLPKILGDADKLHQVFLNVFMNAFHAISGRGTITVKTAAESLQDWVRVDIADNGSGIPPDYRHRIFDPFFTTKENGTGLGLTICHAIVEEHGGRIFVESPEEGGTLFSILLPVAENPSFTGGEEISNYVP
jgi:signal transduction histidine kinase/CheY-like chemotaxis protein